MLLPCSLLAKDIGHNPEKRVRECRKREAQKSLR